MIMIILIIKLLSVIHGTVIASSSQYNHNIYHNVNAQSRWSVKKMSATMMMVMMMGIQRIITEAGLSAEDCSQVYTTTSWCREGGTFS